VTGIDLDHHGDKDLAPGLIDLAVNLRRPQPPQWLRERLIRETDWASYPDAAPARRAIAEHHGVAEEMVLPLAGAAEGFTLIARALPGPARVVHPQFTEPEAALRAAGRDVERLILTPESGFTLPCPPPLLRAPAGLLVVGNPTNPTGVLHRRDDLLALPARALVVDEAFLDAIPGEPETLIAPAMPGRIVLRSLTKTWALAGIRVGYAVGDPTLIALLAAHQSPWSVSASAIVATVACLSGEAAAEARQLAEQARGHRADLVARLSAIGLGPVPGRAPFVLVDTASFASASLREPLAELGFAVRRGESFPGLGPTWLRLAVRTPDIHRRLAEALLRLKKDD